MRNDRIKTERVQAVCTAVELTARRFSLCFEQGGEVMPSLPNIYFGIDLMPEASLDQARALAGIINVHMANVHALIFPDSPPYVDSLPLPKPGRARPARSAKRLH